MWIQTKRLVIRDFERRDAARLWEIVREPGIVRFMRDWSENSPTPESLYGFIDWMQSRKDSAEVRENRRFAVVLPETDELIGMVGMGLEDTLNEVETAWFLAEAHQHRGYMREAVSALTDWCFEKSDLPYLIATVDYANEPSCAVARACGYELFEKRTPIGHAQPNMESDSYFYYRKVRKKA